MAKVIVKNDGDAATEMDDGASLQELEGRTSVLFACKTASCGSCLVKVVEGAENLEPPGEQEKIGLEAFSTQSDQRLCCQARIKKGTVTVEY